MRFNWTLEGEEYEVITNRQIQNGELIYTLHISGKADDKILDESFNSQDLFLPRFSECIKRIFPEAQPQEINGLLTKIRKLPGENG